MRVGDGGRRRPGAPRARHEPPRRLRGQRAVVLGGLRGRRHLEVLLLDLHGVVAHVVVVDAELALPARPRVPPPLLRRGLLALEGLALPRAPQRVVGGPAELFASKRRFQLVGGRGDRACAGAGASRRVPGTRDAPRAAPGRRPRGAARTSTGGRAGGVARPGDAARRPGARAGAIAAAANKLEAALRREKLGGAADDALRRARQGQPFESEEPPAKKRRRDPRTRRERKLSIDYDDVGDDAMEVEEEDLEMPPPAEPPKDDRALSAQAAGRLVAGARGPRAAAAPVPDAHRARQREGCLLYTSDAADE